MLAEQKESSSYRPHVETGLFAIRTRTYRPKRRPARFADDHGPGDVSRHSLIDFEGKAGAFRDRLHIAFGKEQTLSEATRKAAVLIPASLETDVRTNADLSFLSLSALIRVGLGMAAGLQREEALRKYARWSPESETTATE